MRGRRLWSTPISQSFTARHTIGPPTFHGIPLCSNARFFFRLVFFFFLITVIETERQTTRNGMFTLQQTIVTCPTAVIYPDLAMRNPLIFPFIFLLLLLLPPPPPPPPSGGVIALPFAFQTCRCFAAGNDQYQKRKKSGRYTANRCTPVGSRPYRIRECLKKKLACCCCATPPDVPTLRVEFYRHLSYPGFDSRTKRNSTYRFYGLGLKPSCTTFKNNNDETNPTCLDRFRIIFVHFHPTTWRWPDWFREFWALLFFGPDVRVSEQQLTRFDLTSFDYNETRAVSLTSSILISILNVSAHT